MHLFHRTLVTFIFGSLISIIFGKVTIKGDIYNFSMDWPLRKTYNFANTVSFYGAGQFSKIPINIKSSIQVKVVDILPNQSVSLEISWALPETFLRNHLSGNKNDNKKVSKVIITKDGKLETTNNQLRALALFKLLPNGSIKKGSKWDRELNSLGNIGAQFFGNTDLKINCELLGTVKKDNLTLAKIKLTVFEQNNKLGQGIGNGSMFINMKDGLMQEFILTLKPRIAKNSFTLPIETVKINCIRNFIPL